MELECTLAGTGRGACLGHVESMGDEPPKCERHLGLRHPMPDEEDDDDRRRRLDKEERDRAQEKEQERVYLASRWEAEVEGRLKDIAVNLEKLGTSDVIVVDYQCDSVKHKFWYIDAETNHLATALLYSMLENARFDDRDYVVSIHRVDLSRVDRCLPSLGDLDKLLRRWIVNTIDTSDFYYIKSVHLQNLSQWVNRHDNDDLFGFLGDDKLAASVFGDHFPNADDFISLPSWHKGVKFKSNLEKDWAVWLDERFAWRYEDGPRDLSSVKAGVTEDGRLAGYTLPCGGYLPDFWLPDCRIFVEVKGWVDDKNFEKPNELSRLVYYQDILVVIATHPVGKKFTIASPWGQKPALLLRCGKCKKFYFSRVKDKMTCRVCGHVHENEAVFSSLGTIYALGGDGTSMVQEAPST